MKQILKEDSKKGLLLNLAIMGAIAAAIVLVFFYVYLPLATNHGATLGVPDLRGKSQEEVKKIMKENKLRYEVIDSTYSPDLPPLAVVRQYPTVGASVKKKRKIYLTVNNINAPTVRVPADLINNSLENARAQLKRVGLKVGKVTEEAATDDIDGANRILGVVVDGARVDKKELKRGISVAKGSAIDLIKSKSKSKNKASSNADTGNSDSDSEGLGTPE